MLTLFFYEYIRSLYSLFGLIRQVLYWVYLEFRRENKISQRLGQKQYMDQRGQPYKEFFIIKDLTIKPSAQNRKAHQAHEVQEIYPEAIKRPQISRTIKSSVRLKQLIPRIGKGPSRAQEEELKNQKGQQQC